MLTGRDKVGDIYSGGGCHIPSPSVGTILRQSVRFIGGGESKAWPLRLVYRETVDLASKAWIPPPCSSGQALSPCQPRLPNCHSHRPP